MGDAESYIPEVETKERMMIYLLDGNFLDSSSGGFEEIVS